MSKIIIDPVTRVEGHLKIEAVVEAGRVKEARSSGTLYRGLEQILCHRDPRDAARLTQRVCGVCPVAHSTAASLALDDAFGITGQIPPNGRILRNLILASNFLQSHILHFYHLAALDWLDITEIGKYQGEDPELRSVKQFLDRGALEPFVPRYQYDWRLPLKLNRQFSLHYLQALRIRRKTQEMLSVFGGKMPHQIAIVPGGVTTPVLADKITTFAWRLKEIRQFVEEAYLPDALMLTRFYPDYLEIGSGCGKLLSYGAFALENGEKFYQAGRTSRNMQWQSFDADGLKEEIAYSWYDDNGPLPGKQKGYSWIKSPRYQEEVYEVGPLARILVNYAAGSKTIKSRVDAICKELGIHISSLFSTVGRHIARALEASLLTEAMTKWIEELEPEAPACISYSLPGEAEGIGLTEAPRGALCHRLTIESGKVKEYQLIVPTTWNASPRDSKNQPGPIEQALEEVKIADEQNPVPIVRIIRSFDPCLACAVHFLTVRGQKVGEFFVS